jgi:hypothetical protein
LTRFIGTGGQEDANQFHHRVARQDQTGITTAGIKFGQLFAKQCQQQADLKTQGPARHQAGQLGRIFIQHRARTQEGIPFRLVQHQVQRQHGHIVAHARL